MTLSTDDKRVLSDVRFAKAREALDDARANLAEARPNTAANRSYYAALNGVRALLTLDGVNPESHAGAMTTLGLRFIRTKLLPVNVAKDFKTLLTRRLQSSGSARSGGDAVDEEETIPSCSRDHATCTRSVSITTVPPAGGVQAVSRLPRPLRSR